MRIIMMMMMIEEAYTMTDTNHDGHTVYHDGHSTENVKN